MSKEEQEKLVLIEATSGFSLGGGEYAKAGDLCEVPVKLAQELIYREKAKIPYDAQPSKAKAGPVGRKLSKEDDETA